MHVSGSNPSWAMRFARLCSGGCGRSKTLVEKKPKHSSLTILPFFFSSLSKKTVAEMSSPAEADAAAAAAGAEAAAPAVEPETCIRAIIDTKVSVRAAACPACAHPRCPPSMNRFFLFFFLPRAYQSPKVLCTAVSRPLLLRPTGCALALVFTLRAHCWSHSRLAPSCWP